MTSKEFIMQPYSIDLNAPKKAAHLSINSDVLAQTKMKHINLSEICEKSLIEALKEKCRQEWLESNQEAIEEYGRFIEANGCFSDKLRCF